MATPHVTGAVALYAANHKRLNGSWPTAAAIKAAAMITGVGVSTYTVRVSTLDVCTRPHLVINVLMLRSAEDVPMKM